MIEKINISNFGSFKGFDWNNTVRDTPGNNVIKFNKLNILYGRNYSGKTTLSKIIQCLETKEIPDKYDNASFELQTNDINITQNEVPQSNFDVRVYNKDFVDRHLGFLKDDDGKIAPFAVIGSENNTIEEEITKYEEILGDVEEKRGLRYSYFQESEAAKLKGSEKSKAEENLLAKLRKKATNKDIGIKHKAIYGDPNYNITKINSDIKKVRTNSISILPKNEIDKLDKLLQENSLSDIGIKISFTSQLTYLIDTANHLLVKKITPTKAIKELLSDAALQSWVKTGIHHHKDKREDCAFCGNKLPSDIWKKMDEHFSKESQNLESSIERHLEKLEKEKLAIDAIPLISKDELYSTLHNQLDLAEEELDKQKKEYKNIITRITEQLKKRKSNIFKPRSELSVSDDLAPLNNAISEMNSLITKNNKKTQSLETDQNNASNELRLSEIAEYIQEIDLDGEEEKVSLLAAETKNLQNIANDTKDKIQGFDKKIIDLKIKIKDEKKGADKVNEYLNHYFGHDGLKLEAEEDTETSVFKFKILRGGKPAYNLSEGECSLVSFCYFMAKLKDSESVDKKLVIFIDDPISSLDSNHIFFIFSLIESIIAKPTKKPNETPTYNYEQLFISTHSLEFLKYLKKLSKPKNEHEHFLVIGNKPSSTIQLMPKYLRNYITELNYLFGEIYLCAVTQNNENHHSFYNFGNNLRKFLEAFLFFKYPSAVGSESHYNDRIKKFFSGTENTEVFVQRLTNEFSHLGEFVDRGVQPIDHAEISRLARFILTKIKDNDFDQYTCLLESIGESDPLINA